MSFRPIARRERHLDEGMTMRCNSVVFGVIAALFLGACGGGGGSGAPVSGGAATAPVASPVSQSGPLSIPAALQAMVASRHRRSAQVIGASIKVAGYRSNYSIVNLDGVITLSNKIDGTSTTHTNLTTIQFVDMETSLDLAGTEAQVYRMYQAAFNRPPDASGLGFWIGAVRGGLTLTDVAAGFQDSDEFKTMYGVANNRTFITRVYQNVLHRDPEDSGLNWWAEALDAGTSRANALTGFSESKENKANLQAAMVNGIDSVPDFQPPGTPLVPQKPSYLNAKHNGQGAIQLPPTSPAFPIKFLTTTEGIQNGYALVDFFQDGRYSLVVFSQNYIPSGDGVGHVYFYKKDQKGNWVDHTTELLADQTGCTTPRKVIVADFNGDGKPDVFAACHGLDRALAAGETEGERPHMLLSQADGKYKNITMDFNCYCHGASAADLNGNGFADLVVTDSKVQDRPYFLLNNKNGTFTADYQRMPVAADANRKDCAIACSLQIYSVELIDFENDGKYDLWLAGNNDNSVAGFAPTIFYNPGNNNFRDARATVLPNPAGYLFRTPLDIVFVNNQIYLSMVDSSYLNYGVQKIDYTTLTNSVVVNRTSAFPNGKTWVDWLTVANNTIVAVDNSFLLSFALAR